MDDHKKIQISISILMFACLVTLSCNIPINFPSVVREMDSRAVHTVVVGYDATLESAEGEIVTLPIVNHQEWICDDIDGELSMLLEVENVVENGIQVMKFNKKILQWDFEYYAADNVLTVSYQKDMDRDYAVIDPDDIVVWENDKWFGEGTAIGIQLTKKNQSFMGTLDVNITQEDTFPAPSTTERVDTHNFFGLISQENSTEAFLCDLGVIPFPENIDLFTPENFQNHCQNFYYECKSK